MTTIFIGLPSLVDDWRALTKFFARHPTLLKTVFRGSESVVPILENSEQAEGTATSA
jgi:hypothetical protein